MTKKEIVNELEKYTTLIPNRQAFERMQKVHLENLLKDFQKKVDNIAQMRYNSIRKKQKRKQRQ